MSKKLGKSADDIFSAKPKQQQVVDPVITPREYEAPKEKQGRGRPLEHKEGWSKVTVVLLDKQIHWLDQLASTIRLNTKAAISRAELIRAAIAAIEESEIDLSNITSEQTIKDALLEKLKK
jgi:hypothetical protein